MKSQPSDDLPKNSRRKLVLGLIACLSVLIGYLLMRDYRALSMQPITAWEHDPSGDCAVVLTGGPGRVREGLSLLARNLVKKLIISGTHPDVEFADLYSSGIYMGDVDENDVVLERKSSTTYGNAQQSLAMVEALACRDIVLVTSQIHMPRAYKTFVAAFPQGFPISKHAIVAGRLESSFEEIWVEVFKSFFYSLWAY